MVGAAGLVAGSGQRGGGEEDRGGENGEAGLHRVPSVRGETANRRSSITRGKARLRRAAGSSHELPVLGDGLPVLTMSGGGIAYRGEPGSSGPRDWRHRLHRGPARAEAARGRPPRPVPRPRAAEARRATLGERPPRGGRGGRHVRRRVATTGPGGLRGGFLPRAFDGGGRPPVRRARPGDGQGVRPRGRGHRPRAHRVPRRPGGAGRGPLRAPRLAARGRGAPRLGADSRDRPARRDDHRLGLGLLRDPPLPGGATADHGHAAVGHHGVAADRRAQRGAVPGGLPRRAGDRGPHPRHRRARRPLLPRAHADHGGGARPPEALRGSGAGADPPAELALDPPGDPDLAPHRPAPRRGPAQPRRLPERRRATPHAADAPHRARGHSRGARPSGPRRGRDELVDGGPHPRRPRLGGGHRLHGPPGHPGRGADGCGLARGRAHRGWPRLVCRGLAVAPAGVDGPAGGWARPEARSARSRPGRLRRGARLLEGDRDREGPSAVSAGGDEAAGRGPPRVHRRAGGGRHAAHPDGPLPAAGPCSASPTGTRSSPSTPSSSGACSRAFAPQRSAFGTTPAPTPEARPSRLA